MSPQLQRLEFKILSFFDISTRADVCRLEVATHVTSTSATGAEDLKPFRQIQSCRCLHVRGDYSCDLNFSDRS